MRHADPVAANKANWNERADIHVSSRMYNVQGLLADPAAVSQVVRNDLAALAGHLPPTGVRGRSLLHLQCHIGTDTVSWARLGAVDVHGLDLSPASLRHAERIASADGRSITWVEGDARFASAVIERRFDIVVTSVGTIVWLPELISWAQSISDLLRPGGLFLIRDDHPILAAMGLQPWVITDDYLGGAVRAYDNADTYTENSAGQIRHRANYEWRHDLAEVITALLNAGLILRAFAEQPFIDWPALPDLVVCEQGWRLPPRSPRIPLTFAIVAEKPRKH